MGIGVEIISFFNRSVNLTFGDINGLRMLELGDQKLHANIWVKGKERVWAKDYFEMRGCHHYSIDWHGQNGAYPLDLAKVITDTFWLGRFDIVTNFGTAEHVENQYTCWRNIHNFGRQGSIYIHVLPEVNRYPKKHCKYFFDKSFFENLVRTNGYTPLLSERIESIGHWGASYIKSSNRRFMLNERKFLSWIK